RRTIDRDRAVVDESVDTGGTGDPRDHGSAMNVGVEVVLIGGRRRVGEARKVMHDLRAIRCSRYRLLVGHVTTEELHGCRQGPSCWLIASEDTHPKATSDETANQRGADGTSPSRYKPGAGPAEPSWP